MSKLTFVLTTLGRKSVFDTYISLANQVLVDTEIIVIDNTLDNIQPHIEKLVETNDNDNIRKALANTLFVRLPIQDSVGISRNLGTIYSRNDYICYVSDDSTFNPFFSDVMLEKAYANVIPICNTLITDGTSENIHENLVEIKNPDITKINENNVGTLKLNELKVYSSSFIIHKDIVKNYPIHLGYMRNLGYNLLIRLPKDLYTFVKVNEYLHIHNSNTKTWDSLCDIMNDRYNNTHSGRIKS